MKLPVYLDNAATTQCHPSVVEVMLPYFTRYFGNAGSTAHGFGWHAAAAVDKARAQVANGISCNPDEIIFTSGATEACNLAIKGVYDAYALKGNHIITVATEHKAVLNTCKWLQKKGAEISFLKVDKNGIIDINELQNTIKPATVLIAIMYANNETGAIQPVAEIGRIAKAHRVLFFCDATQAIGKIKVDVLADGIDLLAFSAHKINGPKGVGVLYKRKKNPRVTLTTQINGGGQQYDLRSGTLNVPGIAGLGKAVEIACAEEQGTVVQMAQLRNILETSVLEIEKTYLNSCAPNRLPNISNISFGYLSSSRLLAALSSSIAASSGSACTSGSLNPSYVLQAMGVANGLAKSAIRFSLDCFTTEEEIFFTIKRVKETVAKLRADDPVWQMHRQGLLK